MFASSARQHSSTSKAEAKQQCGKWTSILKEVYYHWIILVHEISGDLKWMEKTANDITTQRGGTVAFGDGVALRATDGGGWCLLLKLQRVLAPFANDNLSTLVTYWEYHIGLTLISGLVRLVALLATITGLLRTCHERSVMITLASMAILLIPAMSWDA